MHKSNMSCWDRGCNEREAFPTYGSTDCSPLFSSDRISRSISSNCLFDFGRLSLETYREVDGEGCVCDIDVGRENVIDYCDSVNSLPLKGCVFHLE